MIKTARPGSTLGKLLLLTACVFGAAAVRAESEHYVIDTAHTFPSFEFPHMGISVWRGKFDRTQGSVTLDRANHTGTFQIEVDTASINFGLDVMDTRARSDDYLKTQMFPKATYVGKLIFTGDTPTAVEGTLTFMGVSRPLRLTLNWFKCITRMGHLACGSEAEGTLHWADFGMAKFPDGTDELRWHIQVEATRT